MNGKLMKTWMHAACLATVVTLGVGCEEKGPAAKTGEKVDQAVQSAKDAVVPPGPAEKAGRAIDKGLKN